MQRELSVIVPIFNDEKYLQKCIDSILNQTYRNIEIILVDDGSVDSSGEICDFYERKDTRIKTIHKKNEGLIRARLIGAKAASGKYLTFVDGDDWIAADTYEHMMRRIENCDAVFAGVFRYFKEDKIKSDIPMLKEGIYSREKIEKQIIPYMLWSNKRNEWELDPSLCTKIFKRKLLLKFLQKVSNLDVYFGEDSAVVFPFMLEVKSVSVIHDCYYYHRQRERGEVPPYLQNENFFGKLFFLYKYLKDEFSRSIYWNELCIQLEHFYMNAVQLKQQCFLDYREEKEDIFPFWRIPKGAKVVLYGAGVTGKRYFEQNQKFIFCDIVLWVDQNYKKLQEENERVVSPECIFIVSYDYLIIAIQSAGLAKQIGEILLERGIPAEKIIWSGTSVQKFEMKKEDKISD